MGTEHEERSRRKRTGTKKRRGPLKISAFLTAFIYCSTQIALASGPDLSGQYPAATTQAASEVTVPNFSGDVLQTLPSNTKSSFSTSTQFLNDTLTLTPSVTKTNIPAADNASPLDYEYERYSFEDGLDLLRAEYAGAVIVKDVTTEDLKKLVSRSFETAILVLHGEIVLVTSGSKDEVGILASSRSLVGKASFIAHTHPDGDAGQGPSGKDINEAGGTSSEEYVITGEGVYAYGGKGILENGGFSSYDVFIGKLYEELKVSRGQRDQVEARRDLNLFIAEQDAYNRAVEADRQTFRMGGTLSYSGALTAASVTTCPGSPYPYMTPGSSAGTALSYNSVTRQYLMNYSVPGIADISGFTISFDNASTAAVETQNISLLPNLTFGLQGPNVAVRLEIVDINGNKDVWILTGLSSAAERFWRLPVSSAAITIDKTRIKQINFIVAQAHTTATTRTGTLSVRANGLNTGTPAQPVVTSGVPAATNKTTITLSGTKEANTSILINNVPVVAPNNLTTWIATVGLGAEGNNAINITAKSSIGLASTVKTLAVLRDTSLPTGTININSGAVYTTSSTVTLSLAASDVGSGISTMGFSTDNVTWTAAEAYATSKILAVPAGDGNKTVYVKYYDKAGNASAVFSKPIILDTLPPSGTVKVNGGAQFINKTAVTLNLAATDAGSGMNTMSFSTDNITWTTAEIYAATKAWTFAAGNGNKTVYVKFTDKYGRWSTPVSVTVLLDATMPTGSININAGAVYTTSNIVTLSLSGSDTGSGVGTMSFSTDNVKWTTVEAYAASKSFTLPIGDGTKTVYVKYYDKAGNVSAVYSKSIIVETLSPTGTVKVNGGAQYINKTVVTLNLAATDAGSGMNTMSFSTDNVTWTTAETYAAIRAWTFAAGNGNKTVYVKFSDKYGRWSTPVSVTVLLDATVPTGSININSGAVYATSSAVTLNLAAVDIGSGVGMMSFSTDNATWTTAEAYAASKAFTLSAGDGSKTVFVKYFDKAGNASAIYSKAIIVETLPPSGTVKVNNGALYINKPAVTLNLAGTDVGSGMNTMSFSTDNITWTTAEIYAATKAWTFAAGNGNKTVYVKFSDKYGRWSAPVSVTVLLDTTMPTGSININVGAQYTNSPNVTINLSGVDTGSGIGMMSLSTDNINWSAPETYAASRALTLPAGDGSRTVYVKYFDKAGNASAVYSKSILLDTVPPAIVLNAATPSLINVGSLAVSYTVDGVSKAKAFTGLAEGENTLTITEADLAGNKTTVTRKVTVDTIPPTGSILINNGATKTDGRTVVLALTAADSGSGVSAVCVRENGVCTWVPSASPLNYELSAGDGIKTINYFVRDKAGIVSAAYRAAITLISPLPDIVVTSPAQSAGAFYRLIYTAGGTQREELWQLQPGNNALFVCAAGGSGAACVDYPVNYPGTEPVLPPMPPAPTLTANVISLTTRNGLVMKYAGDSLRAIENPGEYVLFDPQFDSAQNLTAGFLVFANGDRLLCQDGRPVYMLSAQGEKTVYNRDGTIASVISAAGVKTRFAYRLDGAGKVISALSMEPDVTGLYDGLNKPVWIKRSNGTVIGYENGFLKKYTDASGNVFYYQNETLKSGDTVTGYRSRLTGVKPKALGYEIPVAIFLSNPAAYAAAMTTLESELATEFEYDASGKILKAVSGKQEVLELANGIPVSFKNASGQMFNIESQIAGNGDLLSIRFAGNGLRQTYGQDGKIESLFFADGTEFRIRESGLERIVLEDGSVLSGLVWNGQSLTGFQRTNVDGSVEIYRDSRIVERKDAAGSKTVFVDYAGGQEADGLVTEDGRTYSVIRFPDEEGFIQRLTQLVKIDLPDGSRIEFDQGRPVRYVQSRQVAVDPFEVPQLVQGRSFVPNVELANAQLRSLTVDSGGFIYSGEILFNDGTQYLIENGEIAKQITASGQFVEFSDQVTPIQPRAGVPPEPLTAAETAFRDKLVRDQLDYFVNGIGLHAGTGLPVDNYKGGAAQQSDYSQSTLVGFWAEILVAIARGDLVTAKMTRAQAFEKLSTLLKTYQEVQRQAGWNGMVAFFKIVATQVAVLDGFGKPTGQTQTVYSYQNCFDQYGFGDAINLSVSLASVIGAMQGLSLDAGLSAYRDQILTSANAVLTAQEAGYAAFYDPSKKRFHGAVAKDPASGTYQFVKDYYLDRVFNEFRPGMAWVAARYPQYQDAFYGLDATLREYETQAGQTIEIAAPYDGGAFQMFWPLIHVDETRYPEFDAALRNFLYAQAESVNARGIPGLLSAGDDPGQGYEGKIGLPAAAEADDLRFDDIGSIYGTASAFGIAPHYTLQFLANLQNKFPQIKTSAGFVDAVKMQTVTKTDPVTGKQTLVTEPVFSTQYFGVDQASFILSLLKTSQGYFRQYMKNQGIESGFDALYSSLRMDLSPVTSVNAAPPELGASVLPGLYIGTNAAPDGSAAPLTKQPGFVPTIFDDEFGEGHVFNYYSGTGNFHHTEIEFGEGSGTRRMGLQEYLLLPGRAAAGRAMLGGFQLDLLNQASAQGVFYTPQQGFANSVLSRDPELGEVRRVQFALKGSNSAVGLWNLFQKDGGLDLSQYDFLSVPVRVGGNVSGPVRLKFEFKGTGNIFITETLGPDWQYINIPVAKPVDGKLTEVAAVIQSVTGGAVDGELFVGPLSGFKIRTSKGLDWAAMLGKSAAEIKTLIQTKIVTQTTGGGMKTADEVLENFTIDSSGKLVSGVLKRADGGIQYFRNGQLEKWVFRNGRTVLYEKGIANIVVDLSRGKLETARFYYDQDLKGQVYSFNIQDNERKRTFGADGKLLTMTGNSGTARFEGGQMTSIETSTAVLTNMTFADDGALLRAHVAMKDGTSFDINETDEQMTDVGGGVKFYYKGNRITGIETLQNGKTALTYQLNAAGQVVGVSATFLENGQSRTLSLFEFIQRPDRTVERAKLISFFSNVLNVAGVGGFSVGYLPQGELTWGMAFNDGAGSQARYVFKYLNTSGPILGMSVNHVYAPVRISDYGFLSLTIKQEPTMDWNQDFILKLKSPTYQTLYAFRMDNTNRDYQTFWFPLAGKMGNEGEITLEVVREQGGVGKTGAVYVKDLSYMNLKTLDHPLWEDRVGMNASELRSMKIESGDLTEVGAEIAVKQPLRYGQLVSYLDAPSRLFYKDTASATNQVVGFTRVDGTEVEMKDGNVNRVVLPNGVVNEYAPSPQNSAQSVLRLPGDGASGTSSVNYSYGALRRITQPDGRQYDLSYEFDTDGGEITVFKDTLSGEERRFKDGKLLSATDPEQMKTHYLYQDGELIGAELTYNNRVINSTRYAYEGEETRVTDERGTTWFYDADGNLIKHMTRDGYLYEYAEYSQQRLEGQTIDPADYKSALYDATGLRSVSLRGYQAPDGSWILWDGTNSSEIRLVSGAQGVNLEFDQDQKIKSGQIQFADGLILEIENYIPVRGRFASGQLFSYTVPAASNYEILQQGDGAYLGFRFKVGDMTLTYNTLGELTKAESENGTTHSFSYVHNALGNATSCTRTERRQLAFNGVPFPREVSLLAGTDQKLMDSGTETAKHLGNGFLVGVYREATNQWDVYTGTFALASDRTGLKHFLSEIKSGDSVAAVVSDPAFSNAESDLLALFEGLGAGGVRLAAFQNKKWSFFGNERLSLGQGSEKVAADSFSTVSETVSTQAIGSTEAPVFGNAPVLLGMAPVVGQRYSEFLKASAPLKASADLQRVTVYNTSDEIVYSKRLDGVNSYYEFGKARETFDASGNLLSTQEYDCPAAGCHSSDDGTLKKITLVKARQDFTAEAERLEAQIEQVKFDALYRLAWQDEVARLQIKENVDAGVAQINSQISSLNSQRYQTVKQCRRVLFWKECEERTYEVPGVQTAINQLAAQRAGLIRTGQEQLAAIPGAMAAKKAEIEQATAEKMTGLQGQKGSFLLDILRQEMEPVITDFFRRILGRDASKQEFDAWVARSQLTGAVDTAALRSELQNSAERTAREAQKTAIIQGVQSFLTGYCAATAETKVSLLQTLSLASSEAVDLQAADADKILEYLRSRDLHFGQSAFLSLKEMLASKGVSAPMETLAKETLLIDILTGVIHKFTEGDLLISMFALDRAAAIHGKDFASVKFTYDDLRSIYQAGCSASSANCGLRAIAHIGEDHFVVLEKVTDSEVTYRETTKGAGGESVTVTKDQFLGVWIAKDASGYLMVSEEQATAVKKLSDTEAMKVRGAFFFIFFFVVSIVLSVASMVVSIFSPTFGKILGYAALVAGIIGIVGSLGQFVVTGVKAVCASITQQGLFATIKQGSVSVGNTLWTAVKSVGRFIEKAFTFIKGGFPGGLNSLGSGLMHVKDFLVMPAQEILKDGVVIGHEFTVAQSMARQLVVAGLSIGTSKGLEGLGLDPRLCQLAGAFVGGGFLGIGTATSSFIRSGLQSLAMQGVGEIAMNLGLAPPIAGAISLLATQSLTSLFDSSLTIKAGLLEIAPTLATQFTMGGLDLVARSLGLDPRITSLLALPFSATIGGIAGANIFANGGMDFLKMFGAAITDAGVLGGMISMGIDFALEELGLPTVARELVSGFMSAIGGTALGEKIYSKISDGMDKFTGWISQGIGSVLEFGAKALNGAAQLTVGGFKQAIGAFTSIFSSATRENIYQDLAGIRSGTVTVDGDIWTWKSGESRIDYNVRTGRVEEFFGVGGKAAIDGLGQSSSGTNTYSKLTYQTVTTDGTLTQTYQNGTLSEWRLLFPDGTSLFSRVSGLTGWDINGNVWDGEVEVSSSPVVIPGPGPEDPPQTYDPYQWNFTIQDGRVTDSRSTYQTPVSGSEAGTQDPDKPFFVLANGVGNPSATGLPDYINNLTSDLQSSSNNQIKFNDIIKPPLYNALLGGGATDQVKDILHWLVEANTSSIHSDLVDKIQLWMRAWKQVIAARPVVGVGFSGGFEPLVESLVGSSYNITSLVSLAGVIGNLAGISTEVVNLIITVADQIESGTVNGLRGFLDTLFSKIPVVGDVVQLATSIVGFVNDHSIGLAFDALKKILTEFMRTLPPALPPFISPSAEVLVNVYGTEDILYKLNLVGAKGSIADFTPDGRLGPDGTVTRRLFNIEIAGATHSGYMRRDYPSINQSAVNAFVTILIEKSSSEGELSLFLRNAVSSGQATYDVARKVWIVNP